MSSWFGSSGRSVRLGAAALSSCVLLSGMLGPSAAAEEAHTIGDRYLDGMDTRHAAASIADMARAVGYTATAAGNGRTADNAWGEAASSSLFAFFGHADAGVLQVKDRAGVNDDEFFAAGTDADLLPLYENFRFWTEFVPFAEVDDMRLAIFAGCDTANTHESLGDLEDVAASRGVDATVAFPKLVYYPSGCTSCVYSGNYFWDRFSVHYGGGATLGVALSRARRDLVNKEGNASGWGSYRITGSVARPESVKLRPVGDGEPLTSQPLGTPAYSLSSLTVTGVRSLPGGQVEQDTREGVLVRRDAVGRVLDVWAAGATEGEGAVAPEELRATSRAFVADAAGGDGWTLVDEEASASHLDGERLTRFTWRQGGATPQVVEVEVDQRTGAVTYLGRATAPAAVSGVPTVTAEQAEEIAVAGSDAKVVAVEQRTWGRNLWVVRTRFDADRGPLGPLSGQVAVDAVTGEVVSRATT